MLDGVATGAAALHQLWPERLASPRGRRHGRLLGQLYDLKRTRTMSQPPQKSSFLECCDQPVDAGLGREIKRVLHLVERGRHAGLLNSFVDEHEQFVLLAREHDRQLADPIRLGRNTSRTFCMCSNLMSS